MFPTLLYFLVYIFSVLILVFACLIMGRGGTTFFLCLSIASFGVAATLFFSVWDRFDWSIFYFGLFNFSLGFVYLIPIIRNFYRKRNKF